jgi:formate-dependent nitrite reductase membrane component NrfD
VRARSGKPAALLAVALLVLSAVSLARAEVVQQGQLRVSF